jgi:hypothetical protein
VQPAEETGNQEWDSPPKLQKPITRSCFPVLVGTSCRRATFLHPGVIGGSVSIQLLQDSNLCRVNSKSRFCFMRCRLRDLTFDNPAKHKRETPARPKTRNTSVPHRDQPGFMIFCKLGTNQHYREGSARVWNGNALRADETEKRTNSLSSFAEAGPLVNTANESGVNPLQVRVSAHRATIAWRLRDRVA